MHFNHYPYLTYRCIHDFYTVSGDDSMFVLTEWGKMCTGDDYLSGGAGTHDLDTESECRRMTDEIAKRFTPGDASGVRFIRARYFYDKPTGCYMMNNFGVFWNRNTNGRVLPKARSICKLRYSK